VFLYSSYYVVVKDMDTVQEMYHKYTAENELYRPTISYYFGFDVDANRSESLAIHDDLVASAKQAIAGSGYVVVESAENARDDFYSLYGGLFFLGIFLGVLFIGATVLIIYYKQITEGFEDKHRFEIMQKVGMSRLEVKKTIKDQVLMVFFLPLIAAIIHIAFAFKPITKMLALFNLTNIALFIWCTLGVILVFGLFYAVVYVLTARVYYQIVSAKE
jgi:putative ABC transport system permease protein